MRHNLLLPELFNGMDRFLDFNARPSGLERGTWRHLAACDVEESEKEYHLHFDVPGVKKEDVNIEINGQDLRISGERKSFKDQENSNSFHLRERGWGRFERRFHLGEEADLDKVEARFQEGVLTITVPKKETVKPRLIDIK